MNMLSAIERRFFVISVMSPPEYANQWHRVCQHVESNPSTNDSITSNPTGQLTEEQIMCQGFIRV